MKKLVLILIATMSLIACDKGDETPKPLELTGGTTTSQTLYADETQKANGIKFKATADWEATVSEITNRATDKDAWLTLSANKGGAGDVTLTIFLDRNDTGKDRKAEIRITCGGTTIIITVEQKATNKPEDPGTPEPVKMRYVKKLILKSSSRGGSSYETEMLFEYDKEMRIAKIATQDSDTYNDVTNKSSRNIYFSYKNNAISMTAREVENGVEQEGVEGFDITLNPDGTVKQYVTTTVYNTDEDEFIPPVQVQSAIFSSIRSRAASQSVTIKKLKTTSDYTYAQGYIDTITQRVDENETTIRSNDYLVTWSNGNISKVQCTRANETVGTDEFKYSNIENKPCNWDLAHLTSGEWIASAFNGTHNLGLLGKRSQHLPSSLTSSDKQNTPYVMEFTYILDKEGYVVSRKGTQMENPNITNDPIYSEITTIEYIK